MDGGHIYEIIEPGLELEVFDDRDCRAGRNHHELLVAVSGAIEDLVAELLLD